MDKSDEAREQVSEQATVRSINRRESAAQPLRRSVISETPAKSENGLLVFDPGPEGAVTAEHVMNIKDDLEGLP